LSLTVKDIKSMHASLQKMLEGEIISDYQCDGCKRKVDIKKRTLISSTPNVLIVHLQRIIFNFDTFANDKINSYFEFPNVLDLKPYSFYHIMKEENRLNKEGDEDEEKEEEEEPLPAKKVEGEEEEEPQVWPEEEDCFEYKLVGVTVHTGSANSGHYYSYINTKRGTAEDENDPNWERTDLDPWMEFNDSRVTEFNFDRLKEECFGTDNTTASNSTFASSYSYGKSAYMLVYERRKKKPLKVLVLDEEEKKQALYDEKKEEYYKLVDYKDFQGIKPNKIYQQVLEDNNAVQFDNDIYSQEFFDFISQIMKAVAEKAHPEEKGESKLRQMMLQIGKKAILEIVVKAFANGCISEMVKEFIEILDKCTDGEIKMFMQDCLVDQGDYIYEILIESKDRKAQ